MAGKTRTQTPKRRRSSSAAGIVDPRLSQMVGKRLTVPGRVFPKEKVPKGASGWPAVVTGVDHSHDDHLFVAFPGWPEQYYFPVSEIEKWMDVQEELPSGDDSEIDSEFELDLDAPPTDPAAAGPSSPPKNRPTSAGKGVPESPGKKAGASASGRKPAAAGATQAATATTKSVGGKRKAEKEDEEIEEEIKPQEQGAGRSKKVQVEKRGKEEAARPAQRPRREADAPHSGLIGKASSLFKELALATGSVALAYWGQIYLKQSMAGGVPTDAHPYMESAPVDFMVEEPQLY